LEPGGGSSWECSRSDTVAWFRRLRALNEHQARTKVVKIYVSPGCDSVEFEMELFLDGRMLSPHLLERFLWTLRSTSRDFFHRIRPEEPKAQA
jgi:hypothetical protein